jgi:diphthamide biosynthesis methyltransferase
MCLSLSQRLISAACRHGLDQGIHNWILRTTNHVEVELIPNGHPLIATLHHFTNDMFIFDENQGLLTKDLELVKIVHQYDRHKFLQSWIKEKYST